MGHGKGWGWVLGLVAGAGWYGGMVCAEAINRPSLVGAESVLADLSWVERALNERAVVLGQAPPLPVPGSNHFIRLKNLCAGQLSYFIDPGRAGAGGDFSAVLDAQEGTLPFLTATGITARLNLPTNYFNYSPVFWGGVQGVTNAQTAAGGAYFPVGRTEWTDADYGPAGLRRILGQMIWTKATPYWNGAGVEINVRSIGVECLGSWNECIAYAVANWPANAYHHNLWPHSGTAGYMYSMDCYSFRYVKIWNDLEVAGLSTLLNHAVDFYVKCGVYADPYIPTIGTFDDQGVPLIRDGYSRIDQTAADNRARVSVRFGDTGTAPLNWCDEPDDTAVTFSGWEAKAISAVVRWDVPGGVRY